MAGRIDASTLDLREIVVEVKSVSKTVKGGRVRKYTALVVVGDGNGHVGCGLGKALERPEAVRTRIYNEKLATAIRKIGQVRLVDDGDSKIFIDWE